MSNFFRQAWQNLEQNPWMNTITLATIALTFLILGLFLLIFLNTKGLMEEWGSRIRVTAYLAEGVKTEQVTRLEDEIRGFAEVREVVYRSKEEALKNLEERLRGKKGLLRGLPRNPLPASLEMKLKPEYQNPAGVQALIAKFAGGSEIVDWQYGADWIERFSAFVTLFEILSLTLGGLLLVAAIFVISNTIRLNIFARREEIEIMRLVGATGLFIRAPFYVEGLLQGFMGACLALAVLFGLFELFLYKVYGPLQDLLGNFPLRFLTWEQTATVAMGGVLLGLLGTQVSVGRYLRV